MIPETDVIKILGEDYSTRLLESGVLYKTSEHFFGDDFQQMVAMGFARLKEISHGIGTSTSNRSHS